jgi:hypothetical protein
MHELITRSLLVQANFVACRLRIPDLLTGAARTAEELAVARLSEVVGCHAEDQERSGTDAIKTS